MDALRDLPHVVVQSMFVDDGAGRVDNTVPALIAAGNPAADETGRPPPRSGDCIDAFCQEVKVSTVFKPASLVLLAGIALGSSMSAEQSAPPVGGVTGTIALEGTMKTVYHGAGKVIVATIDGVEHVYTFTKDLIVHGGKGPPVNALEGLHTGTTVVVHYTTNATGSTADEIDVIDAAGLRVTEGIVTNIDKGHQKITVTYNNGKTEVFQLTPRAAAEAPPDTDPSKSGAVKVVIYYRDERGQKVVHFFRKLP